MIINKSSFLGFYFYKRTRVFDKKLEFTPSEIYCDDIGLYIIGQYPNLEYNFVTFTEKKEWNYIAADTINLTILNLAISGAIEIHEFIDDKAYINNLISSKEKNYYLKVIAPYTGEDLFSKKVLLLIKRVENNGKRVKDLTSVLKLLLDHYLGTSKEYNRPEKNFIIKILKEYSKKYNWIRIVSKNKLLGLYKDHKIELERIYIPRITMQHESLIEYHSNELNNYSGYNLFRKKLREILANDFQKRLPQNHD